MGQGQEGIESIKAVIKWGKLDPRVIPLLEEAQIIEMTGWTPEELGRQDADRIHAYKIIWSAKGVTTRQERRELKGSG